MGDTGGIEVEGLEGGEAGLVRAAVGGARDFLSCGLMGVEVCGITPGESRSLNRRFRHRDKTATVLSFSLPSSGPGGMAGQILLCLPAVRAEARRLGIPWQKWLAELALHGFLHILGHRHDDEPAGLLMFAWQKALVRRAGGK